MKNFGPFKGINNVKRQPQASSGNYNHINNKHQENADNAPHADSQDDAYQPKTSIKDIRNRYETYMLRHRLLSESINDEENE